MTTKIFLQILREIRIIQNGIHRISSYTASNIWKTEIPNLIYSISFSQADMKIQLAEWGTRNYFPAPSLRILRAWASSGQIQPIPEKVGRAWMVDEFASRVSIGESVDVRKMSSRAIHILKAI